MAVKRFGVSLEDDLLAELDRFTENRKFPNRSQAIRFLVASHLVETKWQENKEVAGAIVMVYDHHRRELTSRSTDLQHRHHDLILSVQHVHLDHDLCLETIAVRGNAGELRQLADALIGLKGVRHGELVMTGAD